jgi:hypothetical protein
MNVLHRRLGVGKRAISYLGRAPGGTSECGPPRAGKKSILRRRKQSVLRRRTNEIPSEPGSLSSEWRRHRLVRAGVPAELAEAVAHDHRFDVHALLELLDRGCDPGLAIRILAPLEESEWS